MKKIYDEIVEISIEGKTAGFVDTSLWTHYRYMDSENTMRPNQVYTNYDELFEAVADGKIRNAKVEYGFFSRKPYLSFFAGFDRLGNYRVNEKNFSQVTVRTIYKEVKGYSLKDIYGQLPADEFLQYCADRNEDFFKTLNGGNKNV